MKYRKSYIFNIVLCFIVVGLYILNNSWLKFYTNGMLREFSRCYLNDLMATVVLMGYINLLLHTRNQYIYTLKSIEFICFCSGLVWELWMPLIKKESVSDINDMICYLLGGVIYWVLYKVVVLREIS